MTRKDYELIAAAIHYRVDVANGHTANSGYPEGLAATEKSVIEAVAWELGLRLKADNPRFVHSRFMEACGFDA